MIVGYVDNIPVDRFIREQGTAGVYAVIGNWKYKIPWADVYEAIAINGDWGLVEDLSKAEFDSIPWSGWYFKLVNGKVKAIAEISNPPVKSWPPGEIIPPPPPPPSKVRDRIAFGVECRHINTLDKVVEAGFNLVQWYGQDNPSFDDLLRFLDECAKRGLKAMINIIGGRYTWPAKLKDNPGLWGYYIFDEPSVWNQTKEYQRGKYKDIKAQDPNHLITGCYGWWSNWDEWFCPEGFDVCMADCYGYGPNTKGMECGETIGCKQLTERIKKYWWGKPIVVVMQAHHAGTLIEPGPFEIRSQFNYWLSLLGDNFIPSWYDWDAILEKNENYNEIKTLNYSVGQPVTPIETITTKTTTHTCGTKLTYKVSSIPENNIELTCPVCGLSLEIVGIRGSIGIIETGVETITVICERCGSKLALTRYKGGDISQTEQYCPVCGSSACKEVKNGYGSKN